MEEKKVAKMVQNSRHYLTVEKVMLLITYCIIIMSNVFFLDTEVNHNTLDIKRYFENNTFFLLMFVCN